MNATNGDFRRLSEACTLALLSKPCDPSDPPIPGETPAAHCTVFPLQQHSVAARVCCGRSLLWVRDCAIESLLNRRRPIGADANPLGRLISSVKITPLRESPLQNAAATVFRLYAESKGQPGNRPDVVNLDYWFHPHVIRQLSRLRQAIAACRDRDARLFLLVCLSVCVRKVSLADPRLSVPVRLRQDQYGTSHSLYEPTRQRLLRLRHINVLPVFRYIVEANSRRMSKFRALLTDTLPPLVLSTDARDLRDGAVAQARPLKSESVTLTITSPPYAGAQKYVRATSLSLGWLDLWPSKELRECENQCIGREHYPKAAYGRPVPTGLGLRTVSYCEYGR